MEKAEEPDIFKWTSGMDLFLGPVVLEKLIPFIALILVHAWTICLVHGPG